MGPGFGLDGAPESSGMRFVYSGELGELDRRDLRRDSCALEQDLAVAGWLPLDQSLSGSSMRSPGNREKSRSEVQSVAPCSSASAAMWASISSGPRAWPVRASS